MFKVVFAFVYLFYLFIFEILTEELPFLTPLAMNVSVYVPAKGRTRLRLVKDVQDSSAIILSISVELLHTLLFVTLYATGSFDTTAVIFNDLPLTCTHQSKEINCYYKT